VVDGPFEFSPQVLTSALRIATAYDYPTLRAFTVKNLEKVSLSAVERIRLAREFGLTSWEGPAYAELHERDDAITIEEAAVLGLDAFVRVAKAREQELRRRGKVADTVEPFEAAEGQQPIVPEENSVAVRLANADATIARLPELPTKLAPTTQEPKLNTDEPKPNDQAEPNNEECSSESPSPF
jgi:hypothetical protein